MVLDKIMFTHTSGGHLIVAASMETSLALGLCDDAQGLYLWITDSTTELIRINVHTCKVEKIGKLGIAMQEISFDNQGRLLGGNGEDVYHINTKNASLSMIGGNIPSQSPADANKPGSSAAKHRRNNVMAFGQYASAKVIPAPYDQSDRSDADSAFDLARLFMKLNPDETQNMVQLAVIDGKSLDIGVFGYGTIYGSSKSNLSLFQMNDPQIFTTDSTTGNTMSVAEHPRNRLRTSWNSHALTESH